MGGVIFVVIGVVAFLAWLLYFRAIDPSGKTDDQLLSLYRIASKGSSRDIPVIEAELKKRGLLSDESTLARPSSHAPHLVQLQATQLRNNALHWYEDGWKIANSKWPDDQSSLHQHALVTVLFNNLQRGRDALPISEHLIGALSAESLPFRALERDAGKAAIAEYVVWCQFPDLANLSIIHDALNRSKNEIDAMFDGIDKEAVKWLKWSTLLN